VHLHLAGFFILLLLLAAIIYGLWQVLGIWLVYGPLAILAMVALIRYGPRFVRAVQDWRQHRLDAQRQAALNMKRKTAAAEAALGIPVPTKGFCSQCGSPLVAGALYCGHCRYPVATGRNGKPGLPLVLCPKCAERQPDDQVAYCFACGATLAAPVVTPDRHVSTAQARNSQPRITQGRFNSDESETVPMSHGSGQGI
jgi:hypothetical protein